MLQQKEDLRPELTLSRYSWCLVGCMILTVLKIKLYKPTKPSKNGTGGHKSKSAQNSPISSLTCLKSTQVPWDSCGAHSWFSSSWAEGPGCCPMCVRPSTGDGWFFPGWHLLWEGERDFISQNDSVVLFFLDIAKDILDQVYDLFLRRMDLFFQWGKIGEVLGFTSPCLLKKSYIFL